MRLAVIGNGNMGRILQSIASSEIVAVIENFEYQVLNDELNIDVIIDFSHRDNLKYIYDYALRHKCKVVIATTNLNDEDKELISLFEKLSFEEKLDIFKEVVIKYDNETYFRERITMLTFDSDKSGYDIARLIDDYKNKTNK